MLFLLPSKKISAHAVWKKKFIEKQGLMEVLAPNRTPERRDIEILESFAKMIKIENGKGMSVSMEPNNPEFAANLTNDYIRIFDTETILALSGAGRNSISSRIRDIEYTYGGSHRQKMMAKLNLVNMIILVSLSATHKLVTTD